MKLILTRLDLEIEILNSERKPVNNLYPDFLCHKE